MKISKYLNNHNITGYESIICGMLFMSDTVFITGKFSSAGTWNWLSVLISAVIAVPAILICHHFTKNKSSHLISDVLAALLSATSICTALTIFSDFIKTCVLPNINTFVIPVLIIITAVFSAGKSFSALSRSTHIIVPVFAIFFAFSLLLLVPEISIPDMLAKPSVSLKNFIFAITVGTLIFIIKGMLLIFLLKKETSRHNDGLSVSLSIILYSIIMSAVLLISLSVLGPGLYEILDYPIYYPLGLSGYGDYFDRAEILSLIMFMTALIYKIGIYFRIIIIVINHRIIPMTRVHL